MPAAFRPTSATRTQRGAILIESLVALALLSLGAAAMFKAVDHLEAISQDTRQLASETQTVTDQTEAR